MIDPQTLLDILLRASSTFAAMCIPAISVAYVIAIRQAEEEQERMISAIGFGMIAGLVFLLCAGISLTVLTFASPSVEWVLVCYLLFIGGCILVALVFARLGGLRIGIRPPVTTGTTTRTTTAYFFAPGASRENISGDRLIVRGSIAYFMGPFTDALVRESRVNVVTLPGTDYRVWARNQGLIIVQREPTPTELGI